MYTSILVYILHDVMYVLYHFSSYVSIPSIQVQCTQVNLDYFSIISSSSSSRSKRSPRKERHHDLPDSRHAPLPSGRLSSSGSDGLQDDSASTDSAHTITSPILDQPNSSRSNSGRSNQRSLYRTNSSDSISTTTTLKASHLDEPEDDVMDILTNPQSHVLTHTSLLAHTKETKAPKRYSSLRKESQFSGGGGGGGDRGEGKREEPDIGIKRKG